jgi:toxin YoeB
MKKTWLDEAWDDYLFWQTQDKKTIKKINRLLRDIERTGGKGSGKAEHLRGNLSGYSSVRIDEKNRLVYKIENGCLVIISCKEHYGS